MTCETCGADLAGRRADARYCSSACRARARRDLPLSVPDLPPTEVGRVRETCERFLDDAGQLDHPLAAAALALATRIDLGRDGLAGLAAATKALQTVVELLGGLEPGRLDSVDLLRLRRDARRLGLRDLEQALTASAIDRLLEYRDGTTPPRVVTDEPWEPSNA